MTGVVIENIRLKELMLVVNKNKPYFDEFKQLIISYGYNEIIDFINESDQEKLKSLIKKYFKKEFKNCLYDGIARPYDNSKSKWYFITWMLRDAPQQRLQPILSKMPGSALDKKIAIIMILIEYIRPIFNTALQWEWPSISEVMLQRLEGSRRALKGNLFEAIVRTQLSELFKKHNLALSISKSEVKLNDETYDVVINGEREKILMPVKTRETMGGGHALLFTRDIHKSISVAHEHGYNCIPVVIAESWVGNLDNLPCDNYIYIPINPNQVDILNPILQEKLSGMINIFSSLQ